MQFCSWKHSLWTFCRRPPCGPPLPRKKWAWSPGQCVAPCTWSRRWRLADPGAQSTLCLVSFQVSLQPTRHILQTSESFPSSWREWHFCWTLMAAAAAAVVVALGTRLLGVWTPPPGCRRCTIQRCRRAARELCSSYLSRSQRGNIRDRVARLNKQKKIFKSLF